MWPDTPNKLTKFIEDAKVIAELRKEIAALVEAIPGEGVWCDKVTLQVEEIENRLEMIETTVEKMPALVEAYDERLRKLERMLSSNERGALTGLPPIYKWSIRMKKNETTGKMEPGEPTVELIYLGDGLTFRFFPHNDSDDQPAGQLVAPAER